MREVIKCKDAVKIWGPETFCSGFVVIFRRCGSTSLRLEAEMPNALQHSQPGNPYPSHKGCRFWNSMSFISGVFKLWKWTKMTGICGLWIRTWSMPCLMRTLKPSRWPLWWPEMLNLDAGTQPASWAKLCSFPLETCFLRLRIRAIPRFHPSDSEEPMHMVSFGDRTSPSRRRWAEVAEGPVVWGFGYSFGRPKSKMKWVVECEGWDKKQAKATIG